MAITINTNGFYVRDGELSNTSKNTYEPAYPDAVNSLADLGVVSNTIESNGANKPTFTELANKAIEFFNSEIEENNTPQV